MRVHLDALGCRLNEAERATWARQLLAAGHRVVDSPEQAEVIVLNSCAVTAQAVRSSRKEARRLRRRSPQARLVVTGCLATLRPEQLDADLVVANSDKDRLVQLLDLPSAPAVAPSPTTRTRAFVKVQDGCRHRCTFCVVTLARGDERSRAVPELVAEVQQLHDAGHQEVVLTGVHLGGYQPGLVELVDALLAQTAVPRIRLGSLEPWDLPLALLHRFTDPRLLPHLHLPAQHGSDAVLRRMGRRNSAADYVDLAQQARTRVRELHLSSDLMVGFPGETDADFDALLELVDAAGIDQAHIFPWSPRPGTGAARLPDRVPRDVARDRSERLHTVVAARLQRRLRAEVGRRRSVLWERGGRGYTQHWLPVEGVGERGSIAQAEVVGMVEDRLLVE